MSRISIPLRLALLLLLVFPRTGFAAANARPLLVEKAELSGTGIFIWKVSNAEGGEPAAIVSTALNAGLSFVVLKVADGVSAYPGTFASREDTVAPVVRALQEVGIQAWGWQYVRGDDPAGEAAIAVRRIRELGLDGFVVDAEAEYEKAGKQEAAVQYMKALRQSFPGLPMALSSYHYPSYHPQFPWEAFLRYVDYNMPQVYWVQTHNPAEQLTRTVQEFRSLSPFRPIAPVGSAFSEAGWRPTPADILEFRQTVADLDLPAVAFTDWDSARQPGNEDLWAAISGYSSQVMTPMDNVGLPSTAVQALAYEINAEGIPQLLVATDQGVTILNGRAQFTLFDKPTNDLLVAAPDRYYLATSQGVISIAIPTTPITATLPPPPLTPTTTITSTLGEAITVTALALSADGLLWAAGEAGLQAIDPLSGQIVRMFDAAALGVSRLTTLATWKNEIWAGGEGGLARVLADGTETVLFFNLSEIGLPAEAVASIVIDPAGNIWIGTDRGAAWWDRAQWRALDPSSGLASPVVNAMALDPAGGVWFATPFGAIRYDPAANTWRRYFRSVSPDLPSDFIGDILVTPTGAVFLSTEQGIVSVQTGSTQAPVRSHDGQGPASDQTTLLLKDPYDNLWVGSQDAGVSVQIAGSSSPTGGVWLTFDRDNSLLPDNTITALVEDAGGRVWVGTPQGVAICTLDGCGYPKMAPDLIIGAIDRLARDASGNIWLASSKGLVVCGEECQAISLTLGKILQLTPAQGGWMWVVTAEQGVHLCAETSCSPQAALPLSPNLDPQYPPVVLMASGEYIQAITQEGAVFRCVFDDCVSKAGPQDDLKIPLALEMDSQGRIWVVGADGLTTTYDCEIVGDCAPEIGDFTSIEPLLTYLEMTAGDKSEMWLAAGQDGAHRCPSANSCARLPTPDGFVQSVLPLDSRTALVGMPTNGLYLCTVSDCTQIPSTSATLEAYDPPASLPWLRLTPNATLPPEGGKLLESQSLLVEFEGGSLTANPLDLSYQVILTDTVTGQMVFEQTIPRGGVGSDSPGQVILGAESPLPYSHYLARLTVQDVLGNRSSLERQFSVQARPRFELARLGGQANQLAAMQSGNAGAFNLPLADSYEANLKVDDPDSMGQPFTVQYSWIVTGALPVTATLPQIWASQGKISSQIPRADDPAQITALAIRLEDADGNAAQRIYAITFVPTRPWWWVVGAFVLGLFSVATLGVFVLSWSSGLPTGVLLRQGGHALGVGIGYRRYRSLWSSRTPLERLLILMLPAGQTATTATLKAQLDKLQVPADESQLERLLEGLLNTQLVERTSKGYRVAEAALARALQMHEGKAGGKALVQRVRSEHPLFAEAQHFFTAAGFECRPYPDALAFTCHPQAPLWQKDFPQPVLTRLLPGRAIDHQDVIAVQTAARADANVSNEVMFLVIDLTPTDSAWLQIGTLRAAGVQIIPIDDSLIRQGREQQKEREVLLAHLRRFLGRRRDLYNVRDPVADRLNFFGREALANDLLEILAESRPIALFGLRKMGKSSLLQFMRDRAGFPVAYIDLQSSDTLPHLYARILEAWQRSLRIKLSGFDWQPSDVANDVAKMDESNSTAVSGAFSTAAHDLMAVLEAAGHTPQLGLFLDEIEVIVPPEPREGEAADPRAVEQYLSFTRALRGLVQETRRLALLVVGVDPRLNRVNRWEAQQNPVYQFFREEYLSPLVREDCIQMVRNIGQQMGVNYSDAALEFIAEVSGGHPFLARQLCSAALRELGDGLTTAITLEQIQTAAERFVREPVTESLLNENGLWGEVTNPALWPAPQLQENRSILTSLAQNEPQSEKVILSAGEDVPARERSIFELKQRAVLGKLLQDMLRIQYGLFRNWILKYKTS